MRINDQLDIPEQELRFATSRSSGPGGQNVNKVESRVTLQFDVASSPSLTEEQRDLVRQRLATRINKEGVLQVSSQRHRTQAANRETTIERFVELLTSALKTDRPRKPTRVSRTAKRKRLESKRKRSDVKRGRRPVSGDD